MIRWNGDVQLGHWHGNMAAFTNRCQLLFMRMHQFGERHNYTLINIYLGVKYSFFLLNNLTKLTVTLLKIIFKYHYCYYLFIFISFRRKAEKSLESTLHFFILLIFTCIPEQKKIRKKWFICGKKKKITFTVILSQAATQPVTMAGDKTS